MKRIQGVLEIGPLVFLYVDICGKIHSYTDDHDVDEDLRTITHHGGDWTHICRAGVTERFISTDTSFVNEYVASYVCEHHLLTLDGYHNVGHKNPY